jgi:hypothetical protein
MEKSLNVGWSSRDITPRGRKVSLCGQYYERITAEIDSSITVTALAMDNGTDGFTLVSCDLAKVSQILSEDVRAAVKERAPHINSANIFLSATHTHTAPYFIFNIPGAGGNYQPPEGVLGIEEYHLFLVDKITEAVIQANERKISGCMVHTGVSPVATGCCRRGIVDTGEGCMYINVKRPDFLRMEGPDGGPVNLMYIRDEKGVLRGVAVSVPCPAQVLEHQFYISSDYVGRVRKLLHHQFGEDFLYLPLISSAGDLSPRNLVTGDYGFADMYDKDGAEHMAKRIFDAILAEEKRPAETVRDFACFGVNSKRIRLPGWVPTGEEYQWALSLKDSDQVKYDIRDYVQKKVEPYFHTPLALEKKVEAIITRYENADFYREIDTEIAAVRIGNTVWVSNPFELFQEYATRMKAGVKAKSLWSIQLTYDGYGYFPTKEAVRAGGYSATISSSRVDPYIAGDILVDESIALADSLF